MRGVVLACLLSLILALPADAQAPARHYGQRLALVIGIADYDLDGRVDPDAPAPYGGAPDLRNSTNDANDISEALGIQGYRVQDVRNVDRSGFKLALANFMGSAPDAKVVIYYSGHAMQVAGETFLIPAGARMPALDPATASRSQIREAMRLVAISTTEVMQLLRSRTAPGVNIVILDACRNSPWQIADEPQGLSEIEAPPRTIIAFSTAPGAAARDGRGRNSPYAAALKLWLTKPVSIAQLFDSVGAAVQAETDGAQVPWSMGASIGPICIADCVNLQVIDTLADALAKCPPSDRAPPLPDNPTGEQLTAARRYAVAAFATLDCRRNLVNQSMQTGFPAASLSDLRTSFGEVKNEGEAYNAYASRLNAALRARGSQKN